MSKLDNNNSYEDWAKVQYRMDNEGFEYCFVHYDTFDYIKNQEFHKLRLETIAKMEELRKMVESKVEQLEPSYEPISEEEKTRIYQSRLNGLNKKPVNHDARRIWKTNQ